MPSSTGSFSAEQVLLDNGYEGTVILQDYSYDDALIGVSEDGRAIYEYDLMVEWLVRTEGFTWEEAVEWIDYNTIRALPYIGDKAPIIMYRLELIPNGEIRKEVEEQLG